MRRFALLCFVAGCCSSAVSPEVFVWAVPEPVPVAIPVWATCDIQDTEGTDNATESEFHVGDYVLYDYFRSSPPCAPCIRWTANEKASVTCRVKQWDTSERPVGFVDSVPTFRLFWCNTETKKWDDVKVWTGFVSAAAINRQIQAHKNKQAETQPVVCAESAE